MPAPPPVSTSQAPKPAPTPPKAVQEPVPAPAPAAKPSQAPPTQPAAAPKEPPAQPAAVPKESPAAPPVTAPEAKAPAPKADSPEATTSDKGAGKGGKGPPKAPGGKAAGKGKVAPAAKAAAGPTNPNRGETITGANLEEEVTRWVEAVSGESKGDATFGAWLKDGQVLCKVANTIQPGIIPAINTSRMPFKQMENVTAFIKACRTLGVLEKDVFSTVDLFEAKNLTSVQRCIFNLGSMVRRTAPDFPGPFLGVAQNAKVEDSKRQSQVVTQFTGLRQDIADELRTGHNVRVAGQPPS